MIRWLTARTIRRAPRRLVLGTLGVAFPVAMLAATMLFVDDADRAMTRVALEPVQIEMRAMGRSLDVDMTSVSHDLGAVPAVARAEPFAATNVVVETPGAGKWTARLIAVDPSYFAGRPWLRVVSGKPGGGALLDEALRNTPGFASAATVSIALPGDAPKLSLTLPVTGAVDLRQATTWFSIPYGDVQGDVVAVPRSIVIDFSTFARDILPVLQEWATHGGISPVFDPGSTDLPPVSLESHVTVDHAAYPPNPSRATAWSGQLRSLLERRAAGSILVADNAAETLVTAQSDATNAKILFLLLGIPGVLAAGALGLAAGSALAEANRREEALLRLRGATSGQVLRLAAADAAVVGLARVGRGTSRRSSHRQSGDRWTRVARGCSGRTRQHGDAGGCRRRSDHGHPAHPAQKHRTPVRRRRGTPSARAGVDADVEAGLPRSDLHRPRAGHPRHQPPDRRAVADPDRRHVPGAVVLCAAGTHLPVARGHLPGGPGRAGDVESTGGAGAVEAVAFVARSCHPMDGPPSGADGRRSHARSVGGGVRHPGVGVRGDLSDREND